MSPQERGAHVLLDVLAAADRRVEHPYQVEQPEGDRQPDDQCDREDHRRARRDGQRAAVGRVDDAGVALGHGVVELRLLQLVEQVEVELLLDLLLAGDAEHGLLLRGHGGDPVVCRGLLAAHGVALERERGDVRVERGEYRAPHGRQFAVHLADHGILLRTVRKQAAAREYGLVVSVDLCRHGLAGHRCRHRDQFAGVRRGAEVVAHEPRHRDLVLERQPLGLVAAALGDVARGLRLEVDHAVAALEFLDAAVHVAQLAPDDVEPGADEVGGDHRDAALVLHGVLVVYRHEGVDHLLARRGTVFDIVTVTTEACLFATSHFTALR